MVKKPTPATASPGTPGAEDLTEGGYERKPRTTADAVEFEGTVIEQLPNATFRLQLPNGHKVLAHTAGRMRKHFIRIMPGDRVIVAVSPYDPTRGRIVYRYR